MWRQVLFRIFILILCVVAMMFAVSNRGLVDVSFGPVPIILQLPLYVALLVSVIIGLVCGWILCWFNQSSWRRQARHSRRMLKKLRPVPSSVSTLDPIDEPSEAGSGGNQAR